PDDGHSRCDRDRDTAAIRPGGRAPRPRDRLRHPAPLLRGAPSIALLRVPAPRSSLLPRLGPPHRRGRLDREGGLRAEPSLPLPPGGLLHALRARPHTPSSPPVPPRLRDRGADLSPGPPPLRPRGRSRRRDRSGDIRALPLL